MSPVVRAVTTGLPVIGTSRGTSRRRCRTCCVGPIAPLAEESMTLFGFLRAALRRRASVPSSDSESPVMPEVALPDDGPDARRSAGRGTTLKDSGARP